VGIRGIEMLSRSPPPRVQNEANVPNSTRYQYKQQRVKRRR